MQTLGLIEVPELLLELCHELNACSAVSRQINWGEFLSHDPARHRIDIEANNVAPDSVRFEQRRATTHKRVGDPLPTMVVRSIKILLQRALAELRQQEGTK